MLWLGCSVAALTLLLLAWFLWFSNNAIITTTHNLQYKNAPSGGIRVAHISDLHGKSFKKNNKKLLNKIAEQKVDAIFITGDLIDRYSQKNLAVAYLFAQNCVKIAPVFYVSGNHEMRSKKYKYFKEHLIKLGVIVLDNAYADFKGIRIFGANCAFIKNRTAEKMLAAANENDGNSSIVCGRSALETSGENTERLNILLAHFPQYFKSYVSGGYNLVLCGHAHGGQWRIPLLNIGLYAPGQGVFPKYTAGKHVDGKTTMIISRGLGNSRFPLRLFNRPELVILNITQSE